MLVILLVPRITSLRTALLDLIRIAYRSGLCHSSVQMLTCYKHEHFNNFVFFIGLVLVNKTQEDSICCLEKFVFKFKSIYDFQFNGK